MNRKRVKAKTALARFFTSLLRECSSIACLFFAIITIVLIVRNSVRCRVYNVCVEVEIYESSTYEMVTG